jgi:hypothetical protein
MKDLRILVKRKRKLKRTDLRILVERFFDKKYLMLSTDKVPRIRKKRCEDPRISK